MFTIFVFKSYQRVKMSIDEKFIQDTSQKKRPEVGLVLSCVNLINCLEGILCPCNFKHDISSSPFKVPGNIQTILRRYNFYRTIVMFYESLIFLV